MWEIAFYIMVAVYVMILVLAVSYFIKIARQGNFNKELNLEDKVKEENNDECTD